nr:Chain P, H3K9 mutant peptide [Homo sapiens]5T0K_Q Chain Q, H3K9 mutant peptide [Homo sapiens]
ARTKQTARMSTGGKA